MSALEIGDVRASNGRRRPGQGAVGGFGHQPGRGDRYRPNDDEIRIDAQRSQVPGCRNVGVRSCSGHNSLVNGFAPSGMAAAVSESEDFIGSPHPVQSTGDDFAARGPIPARNRESGIDLAMRLIPFSGSRVQLAMSSTSLLKSVTILADPVESRFAWKEHHGRLAGTGSRGNRRG